MEPGTERLIKDMIATERSRRRSDEAQELNEIRNRFTASGALGHGRYPVLLDETAAKAYEARASEWLSIAVRIMEELRKPWSRKLAAKVEQLLRTELARDWQDMYKTLEDMAKGSRGMRIDSLDAARDRMSRDLEQELSLLVMKEDAARLPLNERLAADRYSAVRAAWCRAHEYLDGGDVHHSNAAREAVGAVEALAQLVVGKPHATLGEAVKNLRSRGRVRAPLLKGIEELWGWTSSEPGVRHGADGDTITKEEARYCIKLAEAAIDVLLVADAN